MGQGQVTRDTLRDRRRGANHASKMAIEERRGDVWARSWTLTGIYRFSRRTDLMETPEGY